MIEDLKALVEASEDLKRWLDDAGLAARDGYVISREGMVKFVGLIHKINETSKGVMLHAAASKEPDTELENAFRNFEIIG